MVDPWGMLKSFYPFRFRKEVEESFAVSNVLLEIRDVRAKPSLFIRGYLKLCKAVTILFLYMRTRDVQR